ncbi:MAG: efflux RND transporter periplasmic adaptor subunit [Pseudomonadota bacterium]
MSPSPQTARSRIRQLGLILLALALAPVACAPPAPQAPEAPSTPQVRVIEPEIRRITDWDEYTGRFEAVERVEVRARVSGYLDKVELVEGQIVEPGQRLMVIDQRPFRIALESAQATLLEAEARLELARTEAARAANLRAGRAISQEELDQREQAAVVAEAQRRIARAAVARAELDLEFTVVRSPIRGRVGRSLVTKGNLITGGSVGGTLLSVIVSQDPIYFTFEVSEGAFLKYARLHFAGDRPSSRDNANPVRLRLLDEEDFTHEGTMNFVDNTLDASSGTLLGRASFTNPQGFFQPGQFGRLRLLGSEDYEAMLLPDAVVQSEQSRKFVYTVDSEGRVDRSWVELGPIHDGLRVIKSGVEPGTRVVAADFHRVRLGMPIEVRAEETGGQG